MPFTAAVITVSDTCSAGTAVDLSGPLLQQLLSDSLQPTSIKYDLIPDDAEQIETVLRYHSDVLHTNLIITTGGTGFGPRDVTPEATRRCIDREAGQLTLAMALHSLAQTKFAALSRAVCGIRGERTLIVNMPGSKKAVAECFAAIVDVLPHALQHMNNELGPIRAVHAAVQGEQQPQQRESSSSLSSAASAAPRKPAAHICPHKTGTGAAGDRNSVYPMEPVDRALDLIRQTLTKAHDKPITAENLYSDMDLPPFRASMKDGYTMSAAAGGSQRRVLGAIAAGDPVRLEDLQGGCWKINTGAPIPVHADCVVQVEDTTVLETCPVTGNELSIRLNVQPEIGLDIRPVGCDLRKGEPLFADDRNPGDVSRTALLASVGLVCGWLPPRVGIISTGDELIAPGRPLGDGKIYDSNGTMLQQLCRQFGFERVQIAYAGDDVASLRKAMAELSATCPITICTGGVSMGDKDFVKTVMVELDFAIRFGRVNMKPGKPMTFASNAEGRAIFGLPGNPVSAFVCFHLFVLPALRALSDYPESKLHLPVINVELLNDSLELDARPEYARATITSQGGRFLAEITGDQISSRLKSIVGADVLLHLPASRPDQTHLSKGTILQASILKHHFISIYK